MLGLFNPVITLLHDVSRDRWHPILFVEAPLPGPPQEGRTVRHKSKGHHTTGFDTREEAVAHIREELQPKIAENAIGPVTVYEDRALAWDGQGVPALVEFFGTREQATA